ncbi:MAG: class I SAM-dependent methyltransferase [Candidatus Riflebacteria bacterium]|nr:class I SAM-dependent methyltransferase [Candidatus Riflebacteria bacterium]
MGCGVVLAQPETSPERYSEEYYTSWGASSDELEHTRFLKQKTFCRWLSDLEKVVKPGRILDIGCAMGFFLEVANRRGWESFGVEISPFSADAARKQFGNRIHNGTIMDVSFPCDFFDAVTLFDCLEHMPDPVAALSKIRMILRPGGVVLISTVNVDSLSCKLLGARWPHFKPEHPVCFNSSSLATALKAAGLQPIRLKPAVKNLSVRYILAYFRQYPLPGISRLLQLLTTILPDCIARFPLPLQFGEMLAMARKS